MNEEVQKRGLEFALKTASGFVDSIRLGKNFVVSQAPDVIHQWLIMQAAFTAGWLLLWATIGILAFIVRWRVVRYWKQEKDLGGVAATQVIGWAVTAVAIGATIFNAVWLFIILVAPKAYMLDAVIAAMKGSR